MKRLKKPGQSRKKILRAVKKLFCAGESDISLTQVAKKARIAKSLIYHFFKNKEELFLAAAGEMADELLGELEKIRHQSLPADKKLLAMLVLFRDLSNHGGAFTNFLFRHLLAKNPRFLIFGRQVRERFFALFSAVIAEGIKSDVFCSLSVNEATEVILAVLDSLSLQSAIPREHQVHNPEEVLNFVVALLKP